MKTLILMLLACSVALASETSPTQKYKKEYSSLVNQWKKEQDPSKRLKIKKKIESLKSKNEQLFAK